MVGLDTGFFVGLMKADQRAITAWQALSAGDSLPVVSVLTLGELLYISFRTGKPEIGKEMLHSIASAAQVVDVTRQIVEKAAALKAGRMIPYVDSIILATFMQTGCNEIHTSDRNHFSEMKNKGLAFIFY